MPDTITYIPQAAALHERTAGRQAALPGFLARSLLRIDWLEGVPDAWTLQWVLETCRAELRWAEADWRKLNPACPVDRRERIHPSVQTRLPHERAAATVLGVWGQLHVVDDRIATLRERIRLCRAAGPAWARSVEGDRKALLSYPEDRRPLVAKFRVAVAEYRAAREIADIELRRAA